MGKDHDRFAPTPHRYRVDFEGRFKLGKAPTDPGGDAPKDKECEKELAKRVEELHEAQRLFYAANRHAMLLIFQAMDAAGKDSTIRTVMSGVNPAGFQVSSFKRPTSEELDHDFLWRSARRLPERGRIGVFNRSYYEEVLVVRVHPEILDNQQLPHSLDLDTLWQERYASIRDHELHLARNGFVIRKFFLNVSKKEQRARFIDRIDRPRKNWKFSEADLAERAHWDEYQAAYQDALRETSRPWAPWYAIPADRKPYMRATVSQILCDTFAELDLSYPELDAKTKRELPEIRKRLAEDD